MPALTDLSAEALEELAREAERDARIFRRVRKAMIKAVGLSPTADPTVAEVLNARTLAKIFREEKDQ